MPTFVEPNSGEVLVQITGLNLSSTDRIRNMIRHELFRQQVDAQAETFEEADDFDLDDEEEWVSPYEEVFEPAAPPVTPPAQDPSKPIAPPAAEPVATVTATDES